MHSYDPVLLEEDEKLDYPALTVLHIRHMNYCKDILSILFKLRPLIPVNNVLDRIFVQAKSALQVSKLLGCWTLSVDPEHFALLDLIRKYAHSLSRRTVSSSFEKR